MYDNGTNPDLIPPVVFDDITRKMICKITYESNIAGKKPNAMQVFLPATVEFIFIINNREKKCWNAFPLKMKLIIMGLLQ